jgi:hypothetical protein
MRGVQFILLLFVTASAQSLGNCDPLDPSNCMFPFPNNFWLREGKISFNSTSLPLDQHGHSIDPNKGGWNLLDGFSPLQAAVTFFDQLTDESIQNLPRLWSVGSSMLSSSPTILLNNKNGTRVAHWCELDESLEFDPSRPKKLKSLLLWPAQRLEDSTNYIIGLSGIRDSSGALVQPSQAFLALRDNITTTDPSIELRRAHFESIFAALAQSGFARSSLQLAWDFSTGSRFSLNNAMVSARNDALQRVGPAGPAFRITKVQTNYSADIDKLVEGVMSLPLYLNRECRGWLDFCTDVRLVLDSNGNAVYQKLVEFTWIALIPRSLTVPGAKPGAVMQYGHGLFGDKAEITYGSEEALRQDANAQGWVLVASDWLGLAEADEPGVADMLATDLTNFAMVPDRCTQGMVNALLLMRLAGSGLRNNKEFVYNGQSVISSDPAQRIYMGNSQGGILGGVYMALSTDVTRGVLGVTGSPYTLLLPRSADFVALFDVMSARYPVDTDRLFLLSLIQLLWDRAEPSGYLHAISRDLFPSTPPHRVVIQYGLGDAQVSWLGALTIGRSVQAGGSAVFTSNVREGNETLFGFSFVSDSEAVSTGHMMVGFDFGVPQVPFVSQPPNKTTDTHDCPRHFVYAREMQISFFANGTVTNTCGGPCVGIRSQVCG